MALPGLRAVRLIPTRSTAESLLGIMEDAQIVPPLGLHSLPLKRKVRMVSLRLTGRKIVIDGNHVHPHGAVNEASGGVDGTKARLGLAHGVRGPSHPTVPPLHHIPDISVPTLHRMKGLGWYRGIAEPPPFITPEPPLRTAPLQDSPSYATANPSVKVDRAAPPMARNFVDGLGYTVHRDILLAEDCKTTWGKVEKIWGGDQVPQHFDPVFNVKPVEEQRKDPTLPQRYQSKPSKNAGLAGALIKKFINSMQDRVPDPFEDLFEMPCSVIV